MGCDSLGMREGGITGDEGGVCVVVDGGWVFGGGRNRVFGVVVHYGAKGFR